MSCFIAADIFRGLSQGTELVSKKLPEWANGRFGKSLSLLKLTYEYGPIPFILTFYRTIF